MRGRTRPAVPRGHPYVNVDRPDPTFGVGMDPALWELYESGDPADEVSIIIRLAPGATPPPQIRIVSSFGEVFTARVPRREIPATRQSPGVVSLKAGRLVAPPPPLDDEIFSHDTVPENTSESVTDGTQTDGETEERTAPLPPPVAGEDGRGVVVGVCDWGLDFTHPNFRNADGTTRVRALWDQRGSGDELAPDPFNYGRLLTRQAIDNALGQLDPCAALGYHPASGDPGDSGSHGTHVTDILAGNRREPGSVVGLATASDIVFVHLAAPRLSELENLGDSVGLLEGLDFVRRQAAGQPCVLHLSAGKTGGDHTGRTLLELAVDAILLDPGVALVQSVGNYADAAMHTHARVGPDRQHVLNWITPQNDRTSNELEVWYSGQDVFDVTLIAPDGREFSAALDTRVPLDADGTAWGNLYHRRRDPNSGQNHIDIFLYTAAPSGHWRVVLRGRDVVDGRLHAWIERDASGRYQSRFPRADASSQYTTNTICNCFRAIAVGAHDGTRSDRPPTRFSSRGPTADGRQKPELSAPGYRVRAARSLPRRGWRQGESRLCVKSGTSMAAPWVSGTVALMYAAAGRRLTINEVRRALIGTVDPHLGPPGRSSTRLGYGYLNTAAAVAAAGRFRATGEGVRMRASEDVEDVLIEVSEPDETEAWAPVWAEDAAAGVERSDVEEPPRPMGEHAPCGCGCGGGSNRTKTLTELERDDEALDEDANDDAVVPFEWEDVIEALEAFEENEALPQS
jgi:subtilisin family serine protease